MPFTLRMCRRVNGSAFTIRYFHAVKLPLTAQRNTDLCPPPPCSEEWSGPSMAHFEPLVLSQTPKTLEINLSVVAGGLIFGFAMMPPCVVRFYTPAARYYATAPL